jgi:zinc protease
MRRSLLVPLLLVLASCTAGAPQPAAKPPSVPTASASAPVDPLDQPLALDTRVTKGTLPNGLTYYVLPHKKPENRAQLWLVVNAGSILEDDDQRGLAHFVEHLCFDGTKRFPKHALVDFLEKLGVRFGPELNAHTSFDETVYTLQVPTDEPDVMARGISVLRDWADGVSFEPDEVEKERGVILEEWRRGRGAAMRLFDRQAPIVLHDSRYAERLAIGEPEIIKSASRDALLKFYHDWYRPDLMAVVAVGDFAAADVESRIKSEFSSLRGPDKPRPRTTVPLPAHDQTLVTIDTDAELPRTSVNILTKLPHRPEKSARDQRRSLTEHLFNAMLNSRLDELRHQPDAPFLFAVSSASSLVRSSDVFRQSATVREDGATQGFSALLEELLRVERHGFTPTELERAKTQLLRRYQQAVKERDKHDARAFAQEIVRNFLEEEAMPGPETELALAEKFLPTVSLQELNQLGKTLAAGSRVISVTGPERMVKPTAEQLLALQDQVGSWEVAPYSDAAPTAPLMAQRPTPGSVTKTKTIPELGVTEWTLSNGVRVVVKPTDFRNDQIRFAASSPGGTSLASDADFDSAKFAAVAVGQSGLGPYDAVMMRKAMAGRVLSVQAHIGELEENLSGMASPSDVETMFQMIHLAFTSPRRDEKAFSSWKARNIETVRNRRLSPEAAFSEDMRTFMTQDHRRRRPTTPDVVQAVDLDKALGFYRDRYADAGDFTFVFAGNIELDRFKTLVETYLASLPSKGRKERWRDVNVVSPTGVQTKTITQGSEPKSLVTLTFHGRESWSPDNDNDLRSLAAVLRIRLREIMRDDLGAVYGVSVNASLSRRPRQEYVLNVTFGCAPDNVEKLKSVVFDEMAAIQDHGVKDDYIAKVKQLRRRAHETSVRNNGYWVERLDRAYAFGDDPKIVLEEDALIDRISSARVRGAAKKYLSKKQYVVGVLNPKNSGR